MSVRGATSCGRSLCGSRGRDREDRRGVPRRSAFAPDASSTVPTGNDRYERSANLAPNKIANSGDFTPRAARATQESDPQQDLYGGGAERLGTGGERAARLSLFPTPAARVERKRAHDLSRTVTRRAGEGSLGSGPGRGKRPQRRSARRPAQRESPGFRAKRTTLSPP